MSEQTNIMEEMNPSTEVNTEVPVEGNAAEATDTRKWFDGAGNEVSKSAFIREKFTQDNMSRKAISEKFDIPYRTVYGATVNMENEAEPAGRGRGVVNAKINVTVDNQVLLKENDKFYLNGEEISAEDAANIETTETDRNTWIKDQVTAGVNRGDVAKFLNLSYGVVYGLTKEEEGTRQKYEVEIDDPEKPGEKKLISRSEYIRMRVADGISKADVAKELGVEYSVVWQATKTAKTDAEKFQDAVQVLSKFVDKAVNPTKLAGIISKLATIEIKAEEVAAVDASTDTSVDTTVDTAVDGVDKQEGTSEQAQ